MCDNNANNTNGINKQTETTSPLPQEKSVYFVPYAEPPKKDYKPLTKKDNLFIFLLFIGSFIFTDFALFRGFNLGFTIAYAIMFVLSTVFIWDRKAKNITFYVICGAISLCSSVTFALYSNNLIKAVMIVLIFGLFTIYCLGISGSFDGAKGNFKMIIDLLMASFVHPFENLTNIFGSIKAGAEGGKKSLSAFFGVLLALPVLIVIIPLLVRSDAAFEGLVSSVLTNIGVYILELIFSVLLLLYIYSFLFGKKEKLNKGMFSNKHIKIGRIPASGSVSFLCVISATYLVYLFSQLAYFFSAFKGLLPEDYEHTASVFARRGFYEMFAICTINIIIISLATAFSKREKGRVSPWIKGLSCFISLFSVLLLATAMQKMRLNIATYGLSVNRVLVFVFMIMMLVVIAFFILHIFAPKISYMQPIIVICSIIFVALSFTDVDKSVTEYNINAYNTGQLKTLSIDVDEIPNNIAVVPYLVALAESDDEKARGIAKDELSDMAYFYMNVKVSDDGKELKADYDFSDFRKYNKTKSDAYKSMIEYYHSLSPKEKEQFQGDIESYEEEI